MQRVAILLAGAVVGLALLSACVELETIELPFHEDFSSPCEWPEGDKDGADYSCADGEYRMRVEDGAFQASNQDLETPTDRMLIAASFRARADPNGPHFYGLYCADHGDGYFFVASPGGAAGIVKTDWGALWWDVLPESIDVSGPATRFAAECAVGKTGTFLTLTLGGIEIASVRDDERMEEINQIGLVAWTESDKVEAYFDDLSVTEISTPRQ